MSAAQNYKQRKLECSKDPNVACDSFDSKFLTYVKKVELIE